MGKEKVVVVAGCSNKNGKKGWRTMRFSEGAVTAGGKRKGRDWRVDLAQKKVINTDWCRAVFRPRKEVTLKLTCAGY